MARARSVHRYRISARRPLGEPSDGSPHSRPVVMFAVVSLALLMSSLDQTIVATALHTFQHRLHASIEWAGWTITVYGLGLVLMLPVAGKLSEEYGRRRVFIGSVVVFTAASLCCGVANDIYVLVALRAVQALGGAGFTPSATGIVVEHFGAARDQAVGLFGSIFPIGAMLGPILGGVFVTYWSWRGVFLANVPIGAALVPLSLRFIPADRPRGRAAGRRFDGRGMALLGIGVLSAMIAVTYLGGADARPWALQFVAPSVIAALALAAFMRHISREAEPFISPQLIHGRGFGAVNAINVLYGGGVAGLVALIPFYAATRYQISALNSGTLLTAQGVAVIVMSSLGAFLLRRTGYRRPLYVGSVIAVVGVGALALSPPVGSGYLWLAGAAGVIGVGVGWSGPASRNACLQLAPEQSASLAALRSMGRQIGSIASVSVVTAIIGQAADPGAAQARVFAAAALVLLAALPVISRVPEHRGSW